jgi:O-acetyl-ADP-ribose deacetylase (regulator of RNase III)
MTDGIWGHQAGFTNGEPELLAEAYRNSLKSAVSEGLKTIAFPSISTGAYGYPHRKGKSHSTNDGERIFGERRQA